MCLMVRCGKSDTNKGGIMNRQEQEKLYRETYKMVYWTCLSLLKNKEDAEDMVQETFIAAFEAYDTLNDKERAAAWIKRIAANKCINKLTRTRTVAVEDEFLDNVEAVPDDFLPASITEDKEKRSIMMNIISESLSDELQRTLILYYFDELSAREISELIGVPEGTVRSRLDYAKKKIKKGVEDYEKKNNDKLYAMGIPFLTQLFVKEAEDLPFVPMTASLPGLSASGSAKIAKTVATTAIKKGSAIAVKKIVAGAVAATLVTGGVITGVYLYNAKNEEPVRTRRHSDTRTEEPDTDEETNTTVSDGMTAEISEESIASSEDLSVAAYTLTATMIKSNGNTEPVNVKTYNANGDELTDTASWYYTEHIRDAQGNALEFRSYDSNGTMSYKFKYVYDDDGNLIREEKYDENGTLIMYYAYEYENGLKTSRSRVSPDGTVVDSMDYEYYDNGNLKFVYENTIDGSRRLFEECSEDGKTQTIYTYLNGLTAADGSALDPNRLYGSMVYEYDEDNKLIKESSYYDIEVQELVFGGDYTDAGSYITYEYDQNGILKTEYHQDIDSDSSYRVEYELTFN